MKLRYLWISFAVLSVIGIMSFCVVAWLMFGRLHTDVASLDFTLTHSTVKQCTDEKYQVLGVESTPPFISESQELFNRVKHKIERHINIPFVNTGYNAASADVAETDSFVMRYSIEQNKDFADKTVQDVAFSMPFRIHHTFEYELSCKLDHEATSTVFRKMSPKVWLTNYKEPLSHLLPQKCVGMNGELTVRVKGHNNKYVISHELLDSQFMATLWKPDTFFENLRDVDVYLPRTSYAPLDDVVFHGHVSNSEQPVTFEIKRADKDETSIFRIDNVSVQTQKISPYSFRDGVKWAEAARMTLPADIKSGYYVAIIKQGDVKSSFGFVVRPNETAVNKASIAVIASTNTWHAYNHWNGGSFYENLIAETCLATDYGRIVSTQRPMPFVFLLDEPTKHDHLFRAERLIALFLDEEDYDYVVYDESDLHGKPDLLNQHDTVLLSSHPEYYTAEMYDALDRHMDLGGNLIYLGGNALYYKIDTKDDLLEKHENGRYQDLDGEFGGFWGAHHTRSAAGLLGNAYDARDYNTFAPYKVMKSDHPIFANTDLKDGDQFGTDASGMEMDIVSSDSPDNVVVIAKGTNPNGFGADMVVYDHVGGGMVFSVGSISFAHDLPKSDVMQQIVGNAIDLAAEKAGKSNKF